MNPDVVKKLEKNFSKVIIANLPHHEYGGQRVTSGDINIPLENGGILAIERKTPEDFLQSIPNRHIFNQVEVMAQNAKYSAVVITGKYLYGNDGHTYIYDEYEHGNHIRTDWKSSSVRAVITAIQFSGCPVLQCPPDEFCTVISELYTLVNKPSEHQGIVKNRIITFPPIPDTVNFIGQLPGVGLVLAKSIMNFAGMMEGVPPDEDGNTYGTVAQALHWISILSQIDKDSRPAGWGAAKILTQRKFMGLSSNQYIGVMEEKQELTE